MASPFSIFRKHQKALLAGLTIMAMFAFVFLDSRILGSLGLRSAGRDNPVAIATRAFGDLTLRDLQILLSTRRAVFGALEQIRAQAYRGAYGASLDPERARMVAAQELQAEFGPSTESRMGEIWLLAKRAEQIGIVVSDKAINEFLSERSMEQVSAAEIKAILSAHRIGQRNLFETMRMELLAQRARLMFAVSTTGITPAQRWFYYQQLNRRAKVEMAAVPVEKFVGQVADPSPAVLAEFFEKHKDVAYQPQSPDPGLREPHRVVVQYMKAEFEKLVDLKSVSDEEVREYYEKNKETQYVNHALPSVEEVTPPAGEVEKKGDAPKSEPPAAPAAQPAAKTDAKQPAASESGSPKPTTPEATKPAAADKPDAKKGSALPGKSVFRLTALAAEKKEEGKGAEPAKAAASAPAKSDKPATDSKPAASAKPAGDSKPASGAAAAPAAKAAPAEKAASAKSEAAAPTAPPAKPEKATVTPPASAEKSPAEKPAAAKPVAEVPPKPPAEKYVPLQKVKEDIRGILARQKANAKVVSVLNGLRERLNRYFSAVTRYESDVKKDASIKAPEKLDLAALAKENGFSLTESPMLSVWEIQKLDIGRSTTINEREPFARYIYEGTTLNRASVSEDLDGNKYLFWKTGEVKEHVAKLDDPGVKAKAIHAWKMIEARALAAKEADALAARARDAKTSLKKALEGVGVTISEPKPFSWVTFGMGTTPWAQQNARLSEVEGVDMVTAEFMEKVFGLEEGQATVVWNHARTSAYTLQVNSFTPSPGVLWDLFVVDEFNKYAAVAVHDQRRLFEAWLDEVKANAGFQWKITPDKPEGRPQVSSTPQAPLGDEFDW